MILKNYNYHPIDKIFAPLRYYDDKLAKTIKGKITGDFNIKNNHFS